MSFINDQEIILTESELRSIIGYPSEIVQQKSISHLDEHCRDYIAKSPFLFISTSNASGKCDVSPRGDAAGFVHVVDDHYLVIPERRGNKRMDSLCNILSNPEVGLIFLIPGLGETLRVNGRAFITKDSELLKPMAVNQIIPTVGIVVAVEECFLHCAKAFKRSGLWELETRIEKEKLPSASKILSAHIKLEGITSEVIAANLEEGYAKRLY
ncbi:pyridoxamine 5'-phosphate oxidase family protein [Paenibacillus sp. FJAT-27812]|uniref:pyridoxamine 5'-phosphate oxidase family protein n=1 Tax=Paenibacillus sp. FJAT-27812 TaxID=1684143 RepID=UPI0006A75E79|nr:pyridoxamine 5'-phosphate oxidase family protein [Paenibacillus sp. FJAT-27812]